MINKKTNKKQYDVIVVGGGASGLMAAITAAKRNKSCLLIEKNQIAGLKIALTGKGRCNITNDCSIENIMKNIPRNNKFLYSALHKFSSKQIIAFFEKEGIKTKVERGGRVFPVSDQAKDIQNTLIKAAIEAGVIIKYQTSVKYLILEKDEIKGVGSTEQPFYADRVILACGGTTYPKTGSDGYGHTLANSVGHFITPLRPGLTGLITKEKWPNALSGLTLKNVELSINEKQQMMFTERGELLFTHFGISGPIVLTASRFLVDKDLSQIQAKIDLKPALDEKMLDARIQRDFLKYQNKQFKNALNDLLPQKLIDLILEQSEIPKDIMVNQISKEQRKKLVMVFKNLTLHIKDCQPMDQAIVTVGGVNVDEIDPKTMESKIVKGLYIVGEMLDVDGLTGGYNLTIAFSTGFLAGESV